MIFRFKKTVLFTACVLARLSAEGWNDEMIAPDVYVRDYKAEKKYIFYNVTWPTVAYFCVESNTSRFTGYHVDGCEKVHEYLYTRWKDDILFEWYRLDLQVDEGREVVFERYLKEKPDAPDEWAEITVSGPLPFFINAEPLVPPPQKVTAGVTIGVNSNDSDGDGIIDLNDSEVVGGDPDLQLIHVEHPWRMPVTITVDTNSFFRIYETQDKDFGNKLTGNSIHYNGTDDNRFWIEGIAPGSAVLTMTSPDGTTDSLKVSVAGVEILDASGDVVSELKVGKWENGFSGGTPRPDFIEYDQDRFYIRVTDGAKAGTGTNTAQIANYSLDSAYNDASTTIELTEEPANSGIFISKSQLLVSDDDDDGYDWFDVVPEDEAYNDRTHKIALEGLVHATYLWNGTDSCLAAAEVPKHGSVHLTPIILRDKPLADGGTEVVSVAEAESWLAVANERYAQTGIELTWSTPAIHDPPSGVNLVDSDKLLVRQSSALVYLASEAKALVDNLGTTGNISDIHIFFVGELRIGSAPAVGSSVAEYYYHNSENAYLYNIFIGHSSSGASMGYVVAHEVGHLLTNFGHQSYGWQLMYDYASGAGVSGTKRLSSSEEGAIQGDSHVQ